MEYSVCRAVSQAFCACFLELLRLKHEPLGADSYGKHSSHSLSPIESVEQRCSPGDVSESGGGEQHTAVLPGEAPAEMAACMKRLHCALRRNEKESPETVTSETSNRVCRPSSLAMRTFVPVQIPQESLDPCGGPPWSEPCWPSPSPAVCMGSDWPCVQNSHLGKLIWLVCEKSAQNPLQKI